MARWSQSGGSAARKFGAIGSAERLLPGPYWDVLVVALLALAALVMPLQVLTGIGARRLGRAPDSTLVGACDRLLPIAHGRGGAGVPFAP